MCMHMGMCVTTLMWVRGQVCGVRPLYPFLRGALGLNSGHQTCTKVLPAHHPQGSHFCLGSAPKDPGVERGMAPTPSP